MVLSISIVHCFHISAFGCHEFCFSVRMSSNRVFGTKLFWRSNVFCVNGFSFLVLAWKSTFEVFQLRPFLSIRGFTYVGVDQQLPFMLWGSGAWRCQLTCNNKPELFVKDDGLIV